WAGIAKYLTRLGWKVSVLTAARQDGSDPAGDAQVEWCPRRRTLMDYYEVLRRSNGRSHSSFETASGVAPPSTRPGLLRVLRREVGACLTLPDWSRGWILRAALRARSLVRRFQPQVVVSSGPPHSAHLVAGMATMGSAVRWLVDLRDPWAGPHTKAWDSHARVGSRIFRALSVPLEHLTFSSAHGVITNTHPLAEALAARYPNV